MAPIPACAYGITHGICTKINISYNIWTWFCWALLCWLYNIIHSNSMLLIYPYHQQYHWHWDNNTIIQVLLKQFWRSPHLDNPSVWELYQPYIIWWMTHSTHRGTAWCRLTAQGPISLIVYSLRTKVGIIFLLILILMIQQSGHNVAHLTTAVVACATLWQIFCHHFFHVTVTWSFAIYILSAHKPLAKWVPEQSLDTWSNPRMDKEAIASTLCVSYWHCNSTLYSKWIYWHHTRFVGQQEVAPMFYLDANSNEICSHVFQNKNEPTLAEIMVWCLAGNNSASEPIILYFIHDNSFVHHLATTS